MMTRPSAALTLATALWFTGCADLDADAQPSSSSQDALVGPDTLITLHYAAPHANGWKIVANGRQSSNHSHSVAVVYETADGWKKEEASGGWGIGDDRALFKMELPRLDPLRFALQHERFVGGDKYEAWDNNGGADYRSEDQSPILGDSVDFAIARVDVVPLGDSLVLTADLLVRDIAYEKEVELIYSLDRWQTRKTAAARYIRHGVGDAELWRVEADLGDVDTGVGSSFVHFAAVARQAGQEMIDGSFGSLYGCYRVRDTGHINCALP